MFCNKLTLITVYFVLKTCIVHSNVTTNRDTFNCSGFLWKKCFTNDDNQTREQLVLDNVKSEDTFDDWLTRFKRNVSGNFKKPTIDNNIHTIQDEIKTMKNELDQLKLAFNGTDNAKQITTLESSIETLKKLLDDHHKNYEVKQQKYESIVNNLQIEVEIIKNRTAEEKENVFVNDCIESIKMKNFLLCEYKLDNVRHYKIANIIKKVYNKEKNNFDLIIKFANSLQNMKRKFLVFESLFEEMKNDTNTIVYDINKLSQTLNNIKNDFDNKQSDLAVNSFYDKTRNYWSSDSYKLIILSNNVYTLMKRQFTEYAELRNHTKTLYNKIESYVISISLLYPN